MRQRIKLVTYIGMTFWQIKSPKRFSYLANAFVLHGSSNHSRAAQHGAGMPVPDWARRLRCIDGEPVRYLTHSPGRMSARQTTRISVDQN